MPHRREPRPTMPRGGGPARPRVPLALGKRQRRLAEEVLHLHSLWRRGPPPAPAPAAAAAPNQSGSAAAPNQSGSADSKNKTTGHKRRKLAAAAPAPAPAAAEPKDTGAEWAPAPPPPESSSPNTWPEAAPSSSTPAKPPPRPASPGALAHKKALRAAAEFFSHRGASPCSDDEEGSSESEGERDPAGFITGLFERDAALRGHYERGLEDGQFACMACAGGARSARRFRGCVALVQHAHDAASSRRYGRPRAHRALAAVVCRVLGWDFARLPSIVMDPRGTLGQALTAGATAGDQVAKENSDTGEDTDSSSDEDEEEDVETWIEDSSTDDDDDDDEEEDELESSEEATEDDAETGMEDSSTDGDEEENELESREESAEKEDFKKGTEDAKNTDKDESADPDNCEKSAEKVNASKGDSLNKGINGLVHKQAVAKEYSEQENTNDTYLPGSKDM